MGQFLKRGSACREEETVEIALLLARVEMLSGNDQLAVRMTQKELDSITQGLGEKHQTVAQVQKQLGRFLYKSNKVKRARLLFEKALKTFQPLPAQRFDTAEVRFLLAQTLPPTDLPSARSLAQQARQTYLSSELTKDQDQANKIEQWLSTL